MLVESRCRRLLWDATVVGVSHVGGKTVGYRVHYKGWGSRFDEWVESDRVVEPSDNNRRVQVSLPKFSGICCSKPRPQ